MALDYKFITRAGALSPAAIALPGTNIPSDLPAAIIELVPESVARENLVIPLALDGETLTAAAVDPSNLLLRDKLTFILNKKVRLVAAPRQAIIDAINHNYGRGETESVSSMLTDFTPQSFPAPAMGSWAQPAAGAKARAVPVAMSRRVGRPLARFKNVSEPVEDEDSDFEFGLDGTAPIVEGGMFYYVVQEGQRALKVRPNGRMEVVVGPARVLIGWNRFQPMAHHVAHPGEFLIVRFRDGRQEHLPGPSEVWFDPRVHLTVTRQDALQVSAKEAVVVYSRAADGQSVSRRVVNGPTLFVPAPGEWLHTFTWHGSDGGSTGTQKVAKGLVFQKLWLMPDQMYHDVGDVRTADDAVLTIKLMIFFELLDIATMLDTTHDPIGDFINAATSDVVDFTGRRTFEQFKQETGKLNEIEAYRQLTARAAQTGYRINKVVYRGYGAPARLQAMHDQAIEARTKLELDRATEQQAQDLEDFRLNAQLQRAAKRRTEQATEADAELELARKRQEAEREQTRQAAELQQQIRRQTDQRQREHLASLKEMGVDLTAFLTQARADRVIELRGAKGTHVHLAEGDGKAQA
jgi:hypothetical protein